MKPEDEISHWASLDHVGFVICQFVHALTPGEFTKKTDAWIYSPNFVGLEIRYIRVQKLNILFRRIPFTIEAITVLPVSEGPKGYWRAEITNAQQLEYRLTS